MKIKSIYLLIILALLQNCATVITHNEPKMYVDGLVPMMDKDTNAVLNEVEDNWKFVCNKFWTKRNPTVEEVLNEINDKSAISEQEASQVFSENGEYKVMMFFKLLKSVTVARDTISSLGIGLPQAGEKSVDKSSAFISLIFRNDKLVYFHVWHD